MKIIRNKSETSLTWTFIYNAILQELEYCDENFEHFLKKEDIHRKNFNSLNIEPGNIQSFVIARDECLDPKNGTPSNFSITLNDREEKNYLFDVTAIRLKPFLDSGAARILYTGITVLGDSTKKSAL